MNPMEKQPLLTCVVERTIDALTFGDTGEVLDALRATEKILSQPHLISVALEKGILDALRPILIYGTLKAQNRAAHSILCLCYHGTPSQLATLAASAALQPFCKLLADGFKCFHVVRGLVFLLKKLEKNLQEILVLSLQHLGISKLLKNLEPYKDENEQFIRVLTQYLLDTYFPNEQ